jgi:fibronectin-binding autotransporter adhesin
MKNKSINSLSLRKLVLSALVAGPLAVLPSSLWALPSIASGNLSTTPNVTATQTSGSSLLITAPDKSVLTWSSFNILTNESVTYTLPSTTSSVLNSVTGGATGIDGKILSNGNVWILNPAGITISANANIQVGGFYASTVNDPTAALLFGATGTFSPTATTAVAPTNNITVIGGSSIVAEGPGNAVNLYGKSVDIQGGGANGIFGNLFVGAYAGGVVTVGGTGTVVIGQVGVPAAGGNLTILSNGGDMTFGSVGATGVQVAGNAVLLDSTISTVAGANSGTIKGTAGAIKMNTGTGSLDIAQNTSTLTANAGAGTFAKDITLKGNYNTVGASGANVSINNTGTNDLVLSNLIATGTLTATNPTLTPGGSISTSGNAASVAGNISLTAGGNTVTSSKSITFTGTGNLTFGTLANASTATITGDADISLPAALATGINRNISVTTTGGKITTGTISSASTINLVATSDINLAGNIQGAGSKLNITSSAGKITSAAISADTSGTISAAGDITLGVVNLTGGVTTVTSGGNFVMTSMSQTSNGGGLTLTAPGSITIGAIQSANSATSLTSTGGNIVLTGNLATNNGGLTLSANTISLTGNLSSNNGSISVVAPNSVTLTGNLSTRNGGVTVSGSSFTLTGALSTNNAAVNMTTTSGDLAVGGTITLGTTGATSGNGQGNITLTSANNLTVTGAVTLNAGPSTSQTSTGNFATTAAGTTTFGSTITQNFAAGNITITSGSNIAITGAITNNKALTLSSTSGTISFASIVSSATGTVNLIDGGDLAVSAPVTAGGRLNLTSTAGKITQTAVITATGTTTITTPGDITLNSANLLGQVAVIGGSNTNINNAQALTIATGTATTGPATFTVSAGGIALGAAASDSLAFGNTLKLDTSAGATLAITTTANTVKVFGNVTAITNGGAVTLGGAPNSEAGRYEFGAVNATTGLGNVIVTENTTLNLGAITTTGTLTAKSLGGDIVNSGKLAVTGLTTVSSGNFFTQGNVTLNNATNALIGQINVNNANNFSVTNTLDTTVGSGSVTADGRGITGAASATVLANKALTFVSNPGGGYGTIGANATGAVTIGTGGTPIAGNLTLQNFVVSGTGVVSVVDQGVLSLGSGIAITTTGTTTFKSVLGAGVYNSIVDTGTGISITGPVSLIADGNISLTKSGHSFGPISLSTLAVDPAANIGNITLTSAGTVTLDQVSTAGTNGSLTVVSTGGDILQKAVTGSIVVATAAGSTNAITFSAPAGAVTLSNPAGTNNFAPGVSLTAKNDSTVKQSAANLALGNVTVGSGALTVDTSAVAGKTISQIAGTKINVYGNPTFKTQSAAITLTNSGNNFGGLTLDSSTGGGANIAITEGLTMNLRSVLTGTGGLTATSELAGIIQTGTSPINTGGVAKFTTSGANTINLNTATNTFTGGVAVVTGTGGNATIVDSGATTTLAAGTSVGGALTVTNSNAAGLITQSGAANVTGLASFIASGTNGRFALTNIGNTFGSLKLTNASTATGSTQVYQSNTLTLAGGSNVSGPATLASISGDVTTSGASATDFSTFNSSLLLQSNNGNVVLVTPIIVKGGLTVFAAGLKNLGVETMGYLYAIQPTILPNTTGYTPPTP